MRVLCLFLLMAGWSVVLTGTAHAKWHRATTPHFVIYANEDAAKLHDRATRLEKVRQAVHLLRKVKDYPPGEGNRLTVFVVEDLSHVQRMLRAPDPGISGYYRGRASGPVMLVPRWMGVWRKGQPTPETVFFHEYAHHLLLQDLKHPLPQWLSEGFAEFVGQARFTTVGGIAVGHFPRHRQFGLTQAFEVPLDRLLTGNYVRLDSDQVENLYARGWLLYHYLNFEPTRRGQLDRYLTALASGDEPLRAAVTAFGDFKKLEKDLTAYARRPKLHYIQIPATKLKTSPIAIRPLSPAETDILPLHIELKVGASERAARRLAWQAKSIANRYASDHFVQLAVAEMELQAKNAEAAEVAADRALQANPRSTQAMIVKGRAIMERAAAGKLPAKAWNDARRWIMAANKIDTEDPEPLVLFHESFERQGLAPTPDAVAALHYALALAPQDQHLRLKSAVQHLRQGKLAEAKRTLIPIAWHPHRKGAAASARELMKLINEGKMREAVQLTAHNPPEEVEGH
ncbi:MAG: hypothetical protein M3438_03780 [Pseudomonadota bacterium]|nr:hypothetical protein [Pseudomonadota bacterium]